MRILFFMRHPGYIRLFDSTLRLLAAQGHEIHVAFEMRPRTIPSQETMVASIEQVQGITHGPAPDRDHLGWAEVSRLLRRTVDYLRFLEPDFRNSPRLRKRAEGRRVPEAVRRLASGTLGRSRLARELVRHTLVAVEHAVPVSASVDAFLANHRPDVVLVTPLLGFGSSQADYVRRARVLGYRCALCVASWDNLTVKGVIHDRPDLVTVWNEPQRQEAIHLHGIPEKRVVSTGAQSFDQWFDWRPSLGRESFCSRVGLPSGRPYVLYMCSSPFIAPDEAPFVLDWITRLRAQPDARLSHAGILVRPHPQHAAQWAAIDVEALEGVAIWPRGGADPVDLEARSDFFDTIFYSAAVVGVNTSALVESAIVGRPVHTLLTRQFEDSQLGMPHFSHIGDPERGVLRVAASFDEHAGQLREALDGSSGDVDRRLRFLRTFVRPHGVNEPATPKLVAAIEGLAHQSAPAAAQPSWLAPFVRRVLTPLANAHVRKGRELLAEREAAVAERYRPNDEGTVRVPHHSGPVGNGGAAKPSASHAREGEGLPTGHRGGAPS